MITRFELSFQILWVMFLWQMVQISTCDPRHMICRSWEPQKDMRVFLGVHMHAHTGPKLFSKLTQGTRLVIKSQVFAIKRRMQHD